MQDSTMSRRAHDALNRYFEGALGGACPTPDVEQVRGQRAAFLARFGPEMLAAMSGPELLRQLPHNASNKQPMDYWLEFKNDDEFDKDLFGSIAGGSAAKFGLWQDRNTGSWRAKVPGSALMGDISEDEALATVTERRDELLAAVEVIERWRDRPAEDIDPEVFQKAIEAAAPRWKASAWLHKYLHLCFPERVTWTATEAHSLAAMYRVGVVQETSGNYARDVQRPGRSPPGCRCPAASREGVGRGPLLVQVRYLCHGATHLGTGGTLERPLTC